MNVTLKDIAERTGLSINTVSLALRNIPTVKKETRDYIWKTAEEMGYLSQKNKTEVRNIGLISTGERLQDAYFYMSFYQYILNTIHDQGYNMMVFRGDACDINQAALKELFLQNSISGLIVLGDMDERIVAKIATTELPMIAIGTRYHTISVSTIIEDNLEGAHIAINYLYEKGFRDIGFIGNPLHSTGFTERYDGYSGAMLEYHLPVKEDWMITDLDQIHVYNNDILCEQLKKVSHFPQAFLCANDNLAVISAKILSKMGYQVPQDISLVAFDNSITGDISTPSITSIDVQCKLQAQITVETLTRLIENKKEEPTRIVIPVTLTVKDSA